MYRELIQAARDASVELSPEFLEIVQQHHSIDRDKVQKHFGLWHDADNMRDAMRSSCVGAARHLMLAYDFESCH